MSVETLTVTEHPEGLSVAVEKLAGLLFDTRTVAPVTRRKTGEDGTHTFEKIERPTAPVDFAQEGEFALKLHETDPNAPLSPVYINLRNLPIEVLDQVGIVLAELGGDKPDLCAGIPNAGVPLARAYSKHSGVPVEDDVFNKEQTATGRKITTGDSDDHKGTTLRIVDDLATRGETKVEALQAAEKMGYTVTDIVVLVDRMQGATEQLAKLGYTFRAALTIDQLLKFGLRTKRISEEQYDTARQYLKLD